MLEEENFKKKLRQFPTYLLLEEFSVISMEIFNHYQNATKFIKINYLDENNKPQNCDFSISQWDLIEVGFHSIIFGNDYRNKKIDENNFLDLLNLHKHFSEGKENVDSFKGDDIYLQLICMANMQFDFQSMPIKNKFNRFYHILTTINQNADYDQTDKVSYIDFSKKFNEITGFELENYTKCFLIIVLLSMKQKNPNIMELINEIEFDINKVFKIEKIELMNIIEHQSKDYSYYKQFDNWNILKYYPIVKSDKYKEKYIISNLSSLVINIYNNIYWNIRNHYAELNSRKFTTYFGYCFECYLEEVFSYYEIDAHKIAINNKQKSPDWIFESENYCFLIEQKATLFPIDTKTIVSTSRFEKLNNFLKTVVVKGIKQLDEYNPNTKKEVIRICLLLDDIHMEELIEELSFKKFTLKNQRELTWITSIEVFEKMIKLLSSDEKEFERLIDVKIHLEKIKYNKGRSLEKIFSNVENDYIKKEINHFNEIIDKIKEKIEDNNE